MCEVTATKRMNLYCKKQVFTVIFFITLGSRLTRLTNTNSLSQSHSLPLSEVGAASGSHGNARPEETDATQNQLAQQTNTQN